MFKPKTADYVGGMRLGRWDKTKDCPLELWIPQWYLAASSVSSLIIFAERQHAAEAVGVEGETERHTETETGREKG